MRPTYIGIAGKAGVGKTTAAYVMSNTGFVEIIALADSLREMAEQVNPLVHMNADETTLYYNDVIEEYGYDSAKTLFPEVRRFLQRFGTEGVRTIDPDYWVNQLFRRTTIEPFVVVPDVRYDNEAKSMDTIIQIVSEKESNLNSKTASHVSESPIADKYVDYKIKNNMDDSFEETVTLIFSDIVKRRLAGAFG